MSTKKIPTSTHSKLPVHTFKAELKLLGINPYVDVPLDYLAQLFLAAGKDKGKIPIHGKVNGIAYRQTLVRYSGDWRLYINTSMLKNSPKRIGEIIELTLSFDPTPRTIEAPMKFLNALKKNKLAESTFNSLSASRKHEIVRYLARLKSEEVLDKNISKAIQFLLGNERFVGRDKP